MNEDMYDEFGNYLGGDLEGEGEAQEYLDPEWQQKMMELQQADDESDEPQMITDINTGQLVELDPNAGQ